MKGSPGRVLLIILCLIALVGGVHAATLEVLVYEKSPEIITKIPYAEVYVNGALVGKTNHEGAIQITHPGTNSLDVLVSKAGYESWNGIVGKSDTTVLVRLPKKSVKLNVSVFDADTLLPIRNASVAFQVNNSSLSETTGTNGIAVLNVTAFGLYQLTVAAPGYRTQTQEADMGATPKDMQVSLFRDDRFSLAVRDAETQAPVMGATVLIDEAPKGITDSRGAVTLQIPRNKVYFIKVRAEGYADYQERRLINENEVLVTILLPKSPYQVTITAYDTSRRPLSNCEVLVDAKPRGRTNEYGRMVFSDLPEGKYMLDVRHEGYQNARLPLLVETGGGEFPVTLTQLQGEVIISVEDPLGVLLPNASVSIEGKTAGTSDEHGQVRTSLPVGGNYSISATLTGYQPGETAKEVTRADAITTIHVVLVKIPETPPPYLEITLVVMAIAVIAIIAIIALLIVRRKTRRPRRKFKF